jgi:5-formyltetrahydrofolate cyclo-ligase
MSMSNSSVTRDGLRTGLLSARAVLSKSAAASGAEQALNDHMIELLAELEPDCLGVYWAVRNEFGLQRLIARMKSEAQCSLALPFAQRARVAADTEAPAVSPSMAYRLWRGDEPAGKDDCGIPTSDGAPVVPDVVVVPCVGYTRSGYRLGYGGGYFDRWLAAHPHVTAIGVAWSAALLDDTPFTPEPHDIPLSVIVTEQGIVA